MTNKARTGLELFGDLAQNDPRIVNLTYDDVVANTGGKTLKEMAYDDHINTANMTNKARHSA